MGTLIMILWIFGILIAIYFALKLIFWVVRVIVGAVKIYNENELDHEDEGHTAALPQKSKAGLTLPMELEIQYRDFHGEPTEREITLEEVRLTESGVYLEAFCHLRDEERTFKLSRVVGEAVNVKTGELIDLKSALSF